MGKKSLQRWDKNSLYGWNEVGQRVGDCIAGKRGGSISLHDLKKAVVCLWGLKNSYHTVGVENEKKGGLTSC